MCYKFRVDTMDIHNKANTSAQCSVEVRADIAIGREGVKTIVTKTEKSERNEIGCDWCPAVDIKKCTISARNAALRYALILAPLANSQNGNQQISNLEKEWKPIESAC